MIEAAWLKMVAGGAAEVHGKCGSCHVSMMLITNAQPVPEEQPFCMCNKCGQALFDPNSKEEFVQIVSDHGWSKSLLWVMDQNFGGE